MAAVVVGALFTSSAPLAAQTPSVTDLTSIGEDQVVVLTADGLEPGLTVFIALCNPGTELVDYQAQCSLIGSGASGYEVDADGALSVPELVVPAGRVGTIEGASCPAAPADSEEPICLLVLVDEDLRPLAMASLDEIDEGSIALDVEAMASLPATGGPSRTALLAAMGLALLVMGGVSLAAARRVHGVGSNDVALATAPSSWTDDSWGVDLWEVDLWEVDIWEVDIWERATSRDIAVAPGTITVPARPAPYRSPAVWTPWVRPGRADSGEPRHRRRLRFGVIDTT